MSRVNFPSFRWLATNVGGPAMSWRTTTSFLVLVVNINNLLVVGGTNTICQAAATHNGRFYCNLTVFWMPILALPQIVESIFYLHIVIV